MTKEFDFGIDKIDMAITLIVETKGLLWWKKQERDVIFTAVWTTEEREGSYKICEITYDKEKSYTVAKTKELIQFRISKGEEIKGGYNDSTYKRYSMYLSSFWSKAKKDEALDYFVNSIVKWKE